MTVFLEISRPFQARPTWHHGKQMTRVVWLFFAVGWLHVPFHVFVTTPHGWDSAVNMVSMEDMTKLIALGRRYGRRLGTKTEGEDNGQ